ncbi:MAG: nucleotide exchange factor GrpE [Lachnospiraceae bacterium]
MEKDLTDEILEEALQEPAVDTPSEEPAVHESEDCCTAEETEQENAEQEAAAEPEAEKTADVKSIFGRKEKKEKKDKKDERIEELTDQVKRQMAEFDNFRKRTDKEKSTMYEMGAKSVIEKLLPVLDNFERGLQTVPEEEKDLPFAAGMNMIYKQLVSELEQIGVSTIETVGKEFDPNFHNAVMQVESDEFESGIVAQELLKGYLYRDSVVRHSMVGVVQ